MLGRVLFSTNNTARVLCEDGGVRLCAIKGKRIRSLTGSYNSLAAGDSVDIQATDEGQGLVLKLHERKNTFGRFNEKGRAEQAIAANVATVFCVTSPRLPPFRPRFIDRLAVLAEWALVPFVIVLNKSDYDVPEDIDGRLSGYRALGYRVVRVSAKTGMGMDELRHMLKEGPGVFTGQSGVGKSSILNSLVPGIERKTGELSEKYDRGKHTTTAAELILSPDGLSIIDTPGIRRLAVRSIPAEDLAGCFPEMTDLRLDCPLGSRCLHIDEEGCAVREAALEGTIHEDRYESYLRILEELARPVAWKKEGVRDPGRRQRGLGPKGGGGSLRTRIRGSGSTDLEGHDELY